MILRSIFLSFILLFTTLFQASFITALPPPLSGIPLTFVIGVLLYHFARPNIGAAWLVVGGIMLDTFSPPGPVHFFSFAIAACLGILLARNVFANRSLYATIGLGVCMYGCALLIEEVWMVMAKNAVDRALPLTDLSAYFWGHLTVFAFTLFFAFGISRRGSEALRRFFFIRS